MNFEQPDLDFTAPPPAAPPGEVERLLNYLSIRHAWPRFSLLDLAHAVGRTNHCTALNSLRRFADLTATDPDFRQQAIELGL